MMIHVTAKYNVESNSLIITKKSVRSFDHVDFIDNILLLFNFHDFLQWLFLG